MKVIVIVTVIDSQVITVIVIVIVIDNYTSGPVERLFSIGGNFSGQKGVDYQTLSLKN